MYSGIGDGLAALFNAMFIALCVFVPLGVWKLIDLIIWCVTHVRIGVQ